MIAPSALDNGGIEPPFGPHLRGIEQLFGPGPQRTLDPFADRDGKTSLGALEQRARRFAVEKFAQDVLAGPASDLLLAPEARRGSVTQGNFQGNR